MGDQVKPDAKKPLERVGEWCIENGLPEEFIKEIPTHYIRFGSTILLRFKPGLAEVYEHLIAEGLVRILKAKTALKRTGIVQGTFRKPEMKRMYGPGGDILHFENGIRYVFDPEMIMFSPGNQHERMRMGSSDMQGETVVDMFAGIGYFSLPIARDAGAHRVYSCEINPLAYRYLCENIRINNIPNIIPLEGDNRVVAPDGIADRVIMGYMGTTHLFLEKAFSCLKSKGLIHYHEACPLNHYPEATERRIKRAVGERNGRTAEILRTEKVKSYGPKMLHVVADILVHKD